MTDLKSLADRLKEEIRRNGPLRVDTYMAACLADPIDGYYLTRDPLGESGDFITAPETSQIFGELIGLWVVAVWKSMGAPSPFHLIELGPGRGSLMSDAIRAMGVAPDILKAVQCHQVEISPKLRAVQQKTLEHVPCPVAWHNHPGQIASDGATILIANEFFDALPIRQFIKQNAHWHERRIALNNNNQFHFSPDSNPATDLPASILPAPDSTPNGAIFEFCPTVETLVSLMKTRAKSWPLAALIVDYGHEKSAVGETLQAVRNHSYHDALTSQGDADLTAHVDFGHLASATAKAGLQPWGPITQAKFLLALGAAHRIERLLENATQEQASDLISGAQKLIDPNEMGELFKVFVLTSADLPPPPPFAPVS